MILDDIKNDLVASLKAKDLKKANVLRYLNSEIKNKEIELRGNNKELTNEDVVNVVSKECKKRKETMKIYEQENRDDLADNERYELEVIQKYLPEQLSEGEIKKVVEDVINQLGKEGTFANAMKEIMPKLKGKADGKVVSEIVKSKFSN